VFALKLIDQIIKVHALADIGKWVGCACQKSSKGHVADTEGREALPLWRKTQRTRAAVRMAIEMALDDLPEVYDKKLFDKKCYLVYPHIYESYWSKEQNVYASA
jgi:hypothetical protein